MPGRRPDKVRAPQPTLPRAVGRLKFIRRTQGDIDGPKALCP